MVTTTVTLPGTPLHANHQRVTLLLGQERLTLPITSEEVQHDGWAPTYTQTPRPQQTPLLDKVSPSLQTFTLNVIFQLPGNYRPVDGGIETLKRFANAKDPVVVAYGHFEVGHWRITNLRMVSKRRREDTNDLVRAEVAITFTAEQFRGYSRPNPLPTRSSKPASAAAPAKTGSPAKPTRYTVRAGDTLSKIAARLLDDANRWPEIARANKINDPRRIRPGQVLTVPPR